VFIQWRFRDCDEFNYSGGRFCCESQIDVRGPQRRSGHTSLFPKNREAGYYCLPDETRPLPGQLRKNVEFVPGDEPALHAAQGRHGCQLGAAATGRDYAGSIE